MKHVNRTLLALALSVTFLTPDTYELYGTVVADRLIVNGGGVLRGIAE